MSISNKYQSICDTIRERISNGIYTERLPARRILMKDFQVSSRTLHKVFIQLKILGVIDPSPRGTMICNASDDIHHKPKIILITPSDPSKHIADDFIQNIIGNIHKHNFELDWSVCSCDDTLEMLKNKPLSAKDSVIFTNSTFSVEAGNYLKEKNITFVSSNRPAPGVDINWVDWNHLELFDKVIGFLVNCGARNIVFFGSGSANKMEIQADGCRCLPANHWQILDDFEAVKKSYLLFYPQMNVLSDELYCNAEKYVDYLLTLKHLPDVIWCGASNTKKQIADILHRKGIKPGSIFLLSMTHLPNSGDDFFGIYTRRALQDLGDCVWKLLMFSRLHPHVPCRGIKQHCDFLYNKSLKKIKFNHKR